MITKIIPLLIISYASISSAAVDHGIKNYSSATGDPTANQDQSSMPAYLPKQGDGIKIMDNKQMQFAQRDLMIQTNLLEEYKQQGFVKRKSDDAVQLLSANKKHFLMKERETFLDGHDLRDTHLKNSISQIKLAFDYHPLTFVPESEIIGFAVSGTWVETQKEGWTGISEVFKSEDLGVCDYNKNNTKLNQSSVNLLTDSVTYVINNKPTITMVEGNDKNGYSYKVNWYDNDYYHTLTCALKAYESEELKKLLELATKIDKD